MTKWHRQWKATTVHPNLRIGYFHNVNTKDRAYWLGFLYADGTMAEFGHKRRLELELKREDEESIDRFCDFLGLDKNRKRHRFFSPIIPIEK